MMFSIRSFVLYAVGTSMCGGLLVLLCLPLCALLRRLRAPSKLLCLLWLAVGLRFLLPGGIPVSIRQPGSAAPIQQAGAVVQALTVPAELPAQALPGAAGSAPLPGGDDGAMFAAVRDWCGAGHLAVFTTQVPHEGSDLAVYEVGRAAKALPGVLEAHDMTPEATAVKLMWVLGQTTDRAEAEKLFLTPVQWDIL